MSEGTGANGEVERLKAELASKQCPRCSVDGYWFRATKIAEQTIKRLRRQNHEHAAKRDRIDGDLKKRLAYTEMLLGVMDNVCRNGGDYVWDRAKLAKRPFNLSRAEALEWGKVVTLMDRYEAALTAIRDHFNASGIVPSETMADRMYQIAEEALTAYPIAKPSDATQADAVMEAESGGSPKETDRTSV